MYAEEGGAIGVKVNGEVLIERMDVLKNGIGGVGALPGGGLTDSCRVFACTDEEKALDALVRCPKHAVQSARFYLMLNSEYILLGCGNGFACSSRTERR